MARDSGQAQGEASELEVALDLIDNDCRVSKTFGHSHPYDLIADVDGDLIKVQVKTANTRKGQNQYYIRLQDPGKYNAQNVDLFAGYAPDVEGVFYIPYSEMGKRSSVTFTPLEEMGSDASRERANHISDYTFESAFSRMQGRKEEF